MAGSYAKSMIERILFGLAALAFLLAFAHVTVGTLELVPFGLFLVSLGLLVAVGSLPAVWRRGS